MRRSMMVLLAFLVPAGAEAQSVLAAGDRVYVRHQGQRIEGSLVALGDSIVIATAGGAAVVAPPPFVIYRHVGRISRGKGLLTGAPIGGGAGALLGAVIGYSDGDDPPGWFAFSREDKAMLGGILMGGIGVVVGGICGLAAAGDQWEAVPVRPVVGLGPRGDADAVVVGFETRF